MSGRVRLWIGSQTLTSLPGTADTRKKMGHRRNISKVSLGPGHPNFYKEQAPGSMIFHKEGTSQVFVSEPDVAEKQVNKRRYLPILNGFINKR